MKLFCIIIYLFASIVWTAVCAAEPELASNSKAPKTTSVKLQELYDNAKWQDFIKDRELLGINYDLYRMFGPDITDNAIDKGAGNPRGYLTSNHQQLFCSAKIDKKCTATENYQYANIKPSILLDQNMYTDQEQVRFAGEVIKNITNPFPSMIALEMLNANEIDRKAPNNQAEFAEALVQEARSGVAKHSFNNMVLSRVSLGVLEGENNANNKNFSKLSLIADEAKKRFEDQAWHDSIDKASRDYLLKETVKMEAFKIWMEYHKYKQNERIEALLATMVSEQSSINQLLREKK